MTMKLATIMQHGIGYNPELKAEFHKAAKRCLRRLVKELGLQKGEYDLRSNMGGIAVSGEITLHTDWCYVQVSQFRPVAEVMFRSCEGRQDYTGGPNHFCSAQLLEDSPELLAADLDKFRVRRTATC
jgi:hypothetical protein